MKNGLPKKVLDTFSKELLHQYQEYCSKQGLNPNDATKLDEFTTYMVDRGLISRTAIQRYAILAHFDELVQHREMTKTQVVDVLADRFNLTSRSIWNVLRSRQ